MVDVLNTIFFCSAFLTNPCIIDIRFGDWRDSVRWRLKCREDEYGILSTQYV